MYFNQICVINAINKIIICVIYAVYKIYFIYAAYKIYFILQAEDKHKTDLILLIFKMSLLV